MGFPSVREYRSEASRRMTEAGVPTPDVDARLLLLHVLGWEPRDMILHGDRQLTPAQVTALDAAVNRRVDRVPLQHIIGRCGFRHVQVDVSEGVFVPRPETEVLVDLAARCAPPGGLVVEPCTGSGAVAAALADERTDVRIIATDIDVRAATLARRNTLVHADRVTVLMGDLLDPVDPGVQGSVDVLVCNPPYLAAAELAALEPEVIAGDPYSALVAGPTGHEVSDRLITLATRWLAPRGVLLMELDPRRLGEVAQRCTTAGLSGVETVSDLTGTPRFVSAHSSPP